MLGVGNGIRNQTLFNYSARVHDANSVGDAGYNG